MSKEDILMRTKLDLMIEAASMETFSTHNINEAMDEVDLKLCLENVLTTDIDVAYPVEAIPIIMQESHNGRTKYFVEYDMLYKLMETYGVDELEALHSLAEANRIDYDDLYLLIESQEYYLEKMDEAGAKGGSKLKKTKSFNLMKSIEDLKNKGIKVIKKGNKGKKKKGCKKKGFFGICKK